MLKKIRKPVIYWTWILILAALVAGCTSPEIDLPADPPAEAILAATLVPSATPTITPSATATSIPTVTPTPIERCTR